MVSLTLAPVTNSVPVIDVTETEPSLVAEVGLMAVTVGTVRVVKFKDAAGQDVPAVLLALAVK